MFVDCRLLLLCVESLLIVDCCLLVVGGGLSIDGRWLWIAGC